MHEIVFPISFGGFGGFGHNTFTIEPDEATSVQTLFSIAGGARDHTRIAKNLSTRMSMEKKTSPGELNSSRKIIRLKTKHCRKYVAYYEKVGGITTTIL